MNPALYEEILRSTHRFDAGETAMVSRELLQVLNRTYDVKYPGLKARQFIPMQIGINPGAEAVAYHQYDQYGAAKIISKGATDIPSVDVSKAEFTSPVKSIAAKYSYEWHELKRAAQAGVSLTDMHARAARRAIERGIDDVMASGDEPSGLEGFLNHSAVDVAAATYGAMSANSAEDNYKELAEACTTIEANTKGIHQASGIILPISQYQKIATQPWSTTASELTVLEFFKRNFPGVSIDHWYKCEDAAANNTDDRMVVYARDPEVVEGILPLDFEQLPPEASGLSLVIHCLARVGGVQVRYPKAMRFIDGV
jgi:hypothetical protein